MDAAVVDPHFERRWPYSLKGLMFITFVVAFASAILGMSAILAVLILPLIVVALIRTARASTGGAEPPTGLFATFSSSLAIAAAVVGVSLAAVMIAAFAIAVVVVEVAVRLSGPLYDHTAALADRAKQRSARLWREAKPYATREKATELLSILRARVVAPAERLIAAVRRLSSSYWSPAR